MDNRPHIYKKLLIPTGKFYIGKHNGNKKSYIGSGTEWLKDVKQFSNNHKLDIKTEVLEYIDDISNINERETYWLQYFDTANNPLFYNKSNISHGCHITKESTKEIQSLSSPFRKKIIQYSLDGNFIRIWNCMRDASKEYNISSGDITSCCKEKQKSAGRYIWKYYKENYPLNVEPVIPYSKTKEFALNHSIKLKGKKRPKEHIKHRYRSIIQYDKDLNIVREFECIREACNQFYGIVSRIESNIGAALRGKQKTAYGFIWKYK